MSINTPPRTPTTPSHPTHYSHRRHPSSIDHSQWTTSPHQNLSRRSSTYSTRTRRSSGHFGGDDTEQFGGGGDLGNLADELEGAWDDEEEYDEEDGEFVEGEAEGAEGDESEEGYRGQDREGTELVEAVQVNGANGFDGTRDSGIVVSSPPGPSQTPQSQKQKPKSMTNGNSGTQHPEQDEGYSDEESELDESELRVASAELEARMAAIEALARRGLDSGRSQMIEEEGEERPGNPIERFMERLRDLGAQSGLELGVSRLTSSHTSLTTHLTSQSRVLTSLTSTLLSPLSSPPSPDLIDELLPAVLATLASLPAYTLTDAPNPHLHPTDRMQHSHSHASIHAQNGQPLESLSQLSQTTTSLLTTLSTLSDSLQISRQTQTLAARRLRTVQDFLYMWKKEERLRADGIAWVEAGGWDERLKERDAARVMKGEIEGFERVCEGWRRRLFPEGVTAS